MIRIFGILAILAMGMVAMSDASAVRCSDERSPIQSPHGKQACVFDGTLAVLLDRGWVIPAIQDIEEPYADESCGADDEYYARHAPKDYPYEKIMPITHSITDGKFVKLCVQPHYKWFHIHLDTDTAGSITLEIPKDAVDLRQYDYLDCEKYVAGYGSEPRYVSITGEQIAQTAESRTLKFTYAEPLSAIISFDTHTVIDGIDYSGPNFCIKEYEKGGHDPAGHLPYNELKYHPTRKCDRLLDLNYTLTGGHIDMICGIKGVVDRGLAVHIYLSGSTSLEYLIIDVPWDDLIPQRTRQVDHLHVYGDSAGYVGKNCNKGIISRTIEHQTIKIPLGVNAHVIRMGYYQDSGGQDDFSRIIASIMPSGMPHDDFRPIYYDELGVPHIEPFDKRIDGRFIELC